MYKEKKVGVVVPAHNEQKHIAKVVDTMPGIVDKIIVVDDCSKDKTLKILKEKKSVQGNRLLIIRHKKNQGVGGAIVTGYKESVKIGMDLVAVMAGDGQMDPDDLLNLLDPIADGKADYAKGNRLLHKSVKKNMPQLRFFGNSLLTIFNKIATGYWKTMDPQCGYTVISKEVLEMIPLDDIYPWYGVPNDILTILNTYNLRVTDVVINPVYADEKSGIRLYSYVPKVSILLLKRFFWRMKEKYLFRDFHPLALFYLFGFMLLPTGLLYGAYLLYSRIFLGILSINAILLCIFLLIMGFQFLFFGMLFDMEYNKDLNK